ncbi:hypothetical protein TIFTF001_023520 [Ficus carica]|uniref:Uncharacterized protein n=1 Tax=Ficus carica TaxID=3494 RepID=A0AA88AL33_FICCA|nr:hypothetical protein TIFTF001_023520 [Ficus carica]
MKSRASATVVTVTASLPKKLHQPSIVIARRSFCLSSFSTPLNAIKIRPSIEDGKERTNVRADLLHTSMKQCWN